MFTDREQAGNQLAQKLKAELGTLTPKKVVVLSIPRGGVVVGAKVAQALGCQHDVIVTKKLRAPHEEELAIGAIGETRGSLYLDERLAADVRADKDYIEQEIGNRQKEIKRREREYRQQGGAVDLKGRTVILVDDGAATGATMIAAAREVWNREPHKVVIALPVVARDTLPKLEEEADAVVVIDTPDMFYAVGQFYEAFPQIEDEAVIKSLKGD
jgi:predicted phosphoribosyltransferase